MRILLIKPPIRACRAEIGRHVPVGLAYLASALRDAGHDVALFDALALTDENHVVQPADYTAADRAKIASHPRMRHLVHWGAAWPTIAKVIEEAAPDVVGISCMFTPYYETAYELARLVRQIRPQARTLLGGQHPTVAHQHCIGEPALDVLVLGEAEHTIGQIMYGLETDGDLTQVPGLVFRCGRGLCSCAEGADRVHMTPRAAAVVDLDTIAPPATDLLDFPRYDFSTTLITSRGCPFSCSFCTVHAMVGKAFQARSPNLVVDEIEHYIAAHGIRKFRIEDDNFTFDPDRVREICKIIRKRGLDVELHLTNGITVINLTPELVTDMVAAGFRNLFFGLETTDPAHLRRIRKGFTSMEKVDSGARWFRAHGVEVSASLIVGLLGQTAAQVAKDSANLAVRGIAYGSNPFYPIPGSSDYARCMELGLIDHDTELALFEGFNFATGSDVLSHAEMYWCWITAQALSHWPEFVLSHVATSPADALQQLITTLPPVVRDEKRQVLAVPMASAGTTVHMDPDGCFCGLQRVRERLIGGGPLDFCVVTGDLVAAAIGLHVGEPMTSEPLTSSVHDPRAGCTFAIRPGGDTVQQDIHATFLRGIHASRGLVGAHEEL